MKQKKNILVPILGLNKDEPAEYINDRSTPDCQNIEVLENIIKKRSGCVAIGNSMGEEIMAVKELIVDDTRYVARIGLTKVEVLNQSSLTWYNFTVSSANNKFDFNIGGGQLTATIATGNYVAGATETSPGSYCKALYDAIHTAEATGTYTVRFTANKFVIARTAGTFSILWLSGTNTATSIGTTIGFTITADDTGSLSYTADSTVYTLLTGATGNPVCTATPLLSAVRTLVFTNYVDNIKKFVVTGNHSDLGGSPPKAKYLQEFGSYLVLANVNDGTSRRMRVQWSDTAAIETWTGGNSGSVDLIEDGNEITGLNLFGQYVCIHKETAIYLGFLTGTSAIFQFDRKNTGIGTVCNATIQNLNTGEQVFLARDGIRIFNGINTRLIEDGVNEYIRDSLNFQYRNKCWSVVMPEISEYWVAVPMGTSTTPDIIFKYNYKTGRVYKDKYDGKNLTAVGKYQITTVRYIDDVTSYIDSVTTKIDDMTTTAYNQNLIIGDSAGLVYKRDNTLNNDNGTAINAYFDSKDFMADEVGRIARWLEMQFWIKGNTITISYSINNGSNWTAIGAWALGSTYPTDDDPLFAYLDTASSNIRFRFSNNTASETFTLKQFIISYLNRELR